MPGTLAQDLGDASATLLLTLYLRAMESQRQDALIKDGRAVALVNKLSGDGLYDFGAMSSLPLSEDNKLAIILRNREFDRCARTFIARCPTAVVVHIGCGLDTRYERVVGHDSKVEWYDLDLPQVIDLRRELIGDDGGGYHLLSGSVLDSAWLETVSPLTQRPFLFLAEGVFMYLERAQVKSLVLALRDHFPGAELAFDCYAPIHVWRHNLQTSASRINVRVKWGVWNGRDIERWDAASSGIRLLDEWGLLDDPTPRLDHLRWARLIEAQEKTLRIYRFRLGKAAA